MRTLRLKAWRELLRLRGQMAAVAAMSASGAALFVSLRSMHLHLSDTQASYYGAYRFANVFAPLARGPRRLAERAAAIPGVAAVRARVVADVVLDVPGLDEPATGRLVGVPLRHTPMVNDVYLRRGRWPAPGGRNEVMASESFAEANGLALGDTLGAVLNGRWETLRIVGLAMSPEFVYPIRPGDIFPDHRRYGVLWLDNDALADAFDLSGACNELVLTLAPGAAEGPVIATLDQLLRPWGGLGAYGREDQASHRFLSDEITETGVTSLLIPAIFLAIIAFMLNLILGRLIAHQRDQIAVLKAFGFGNGPIARHYLALALGPALAGALLGSVLGLLLASHLAIVYARFFQLPVIGFTPHAGIVLIALGASAVGAIFGALSGVYRATRLAPAEAMRPEAPARFRRGPLERIGLLARVSPGARFVLRNVERRPVRAALTALGIALGTGVAVTGLFAWDSIDLLERVQFDAVQREDVSVAFVQPRDDQVRSALAALPGVLRVEPYRAVLVRLVHGPRVKRTALLGLDRDGRLRRIVDAHQRRAPLPPDGLLLSSILARRLGVAAGGTVTVEVLEGTRPVRELRVAVVVDELMGMGAYLDRRALNRLLGEGPTSSGAFLAVDAAQYGQLYTRLKHLPGVSGVAVRAATRASFQTILAESFAISLLTIFGFAALIVFGMVYNGARIALSERERELASLRVLGFSRRDVARLLLGEQALITAAGVPAGLLLGVALAALIALRFESESFRIPLVIEPLTFAASAGMVLVSAGLSALLVRRRLDRTGLIEVLKVRE